MTFNFASLGDADVLAPAVLVFGAWLWTVGVRRASRGFFVGLAAVAAVTLALKWAVASPGGPSLWPDGTLISQYFPSGHAALATAVYGSLSVVLAAAGGGLWRYAPIGALLLAIAIAASRVLMRLHPLGDAFFGVVIGLASPVITYVGVLREGHPFPRAAWILLAFVAALVVGWLVPVPLHRFIGA